MATPTSSTLKPSKIDLKVCSKIVYDKEAMKEFYGVEDEKEIKRLDDENSDNANKLKKELKEFFS